jgi:hypothetical protein
MTECSKQIFSTDTVAGHCFGHWGLWILVIVSDFDIRISDFKAVVSFPQAKLDYIIPLTGWILDISVCITLNHNVNVFPYISILPFP